MREGGPWESIAKLLLLLTFDVAKKTHAVAIAGRGPDWGSLDSGAKRNALKKSGFERPFQARQSRLGMAS
jgi:hypothetical protein